LQGEGGTPEGTWLTKEVKKEILGDAKARFSYTKIVLSDNTNGRANPPQMFKPYPNSCHVIIVVDSCWLAYYASKKSDYAYIW